MAFAGTVWTDIQRCNLYLFVHRRALKFNLIFRNQSKKHQQKDQLWNNARIWRTAVKHTPLFMKETGLASVFVVSVWPNQLSSMSAYVCEWERDWERGSKKGNKRAKYVRVRKRERLWKNKNMSLCLCLVPTQISAFVVMAFPWYRLIISGARYERVVYLSKVDWKQRFKTLTSWQQNKQQKSNVL